MVLGTEETKGNKKDTLLALLNLSQDSDTEQKIT